jgi:hypothetical protein
VVYSACFRSPEAGLTLHLIAKAPCLALSTAAHQPKVIFHSVRVWNRGRLSVRSVDLLAAAQKANY